MNRRFIKVKPFGCSTAFRNLDKFSVHVGPEVAEGERIPNFYLGLKNVYLSLRFNGTWSYLSYAHKD